MKLRVGTRGSELALKQTEWVCQQLRAAHPGLEIEQVIIKTHGDEVTDKNFGRDWPVGAFVKAIEQALLDKRIDFAVHSFKDLQTEETPGLVVAATPPREVVHDVLLTRTAKRLKDLPPGAQIGTNSPRRAAQLLEIGEFHIVPIRGNVPTRVAKIERENLDGVVLAAAGLKRLGLEHPRMIPMPVDTFVPAAGQGALAVQTRTEGPAREIVAVLDDPDTHKAVSAERAVLRRINAGCHTPIGALATIVRKEITLHAKLFTNDYARKAEGVEGGTDPAAVGEDLADRLLAELKEQS
ncbi:MAG TPA: hydroxymethylbilane synthase [Phycisphaerae bacterium]|nr:hydroxymethylbilane synthase [Phycisphaerae bacterium]